jgi:hypothetical protein
VSKGHYRTVNKEWPDFNPSPFSTHYFSVGELAQLLTNHQFDVQFFGAFPVSIGSAKDRVISIMKRLAVTLRLMPKTMKGKELLKKLFIGKVAPLPAEIEDGMAEAYPLAPISSNSLYKVIYAVARRK